MKVDIEDHKFSDGDIEFAYVDRINEIVIIESCIRDIDFVSTFNKEDILKMLEALHHV